MKYFLHHNYSLSHFEQDSLCLKQFLFLDDSDIITAIKVWSTHQDPILSDLCTRLKDRKLFKVRYFDQDKNKEIDAFKNEIILKNHLTKENSNYYFLQDSTTNKTYVAGDEHIKILFKNGDIKPLSEVENTLITPQLLVPTKKHYICYLRN